MHIKNRVLTISLGLSCLVSATAQNHIFDDFSNLFTPPESYIAPFTNISPKIDGDIDEVAWKNVPWTNLFGDIEGNKKPTPRYDTKVKMMWDKNYLYVAAELQEPHVWANLTERDQIVFFDNDFEIFLNPNNTTHQYFEIEINALNNIFDLYMNKPYREDAGALFSWDSQGMKHAVKIDGTLNNPSDIDNGWTIEFAIPWRAVTVGNDPHVPKNGEIWRINFSRVEWDTHIEDGKYVKDKDENGKTKSEHNWTWSPQGVINMHEPERWGYLQFSDQTAGELTETFVLPYSEKMKNYLWLIYYKQKKYKEEHGHFAKDLKQLNMPESVEIDNVKNQILMEATNNLFLTTISNETNTISITNEGLIK